MVPLELRDESSIVAAADAIADQTSAIDLLINCAGLDGRSFGAAEDDRGPFDIEASVFNAVFEANVTGPMLVSQRLLPLLKQGANSMIVNVSSQLGSMQVAADVGNDTAYCVSKAALNMLSVKSATELRPHAVGVVMLHPGWVATDMGGSTADLSVDEAGASIASTISALTIADTGRFIQWDGTDHPW